MPPATRPWVLHDFGPVEEVLLDPVDAVTVTTLMDNSLDLFMPDQGVAHRVGPQPTPSVPCAVMTDRTGPGRADSRARVLGPGDRHEGRVTTSCPVRLRG